MRKHFEFSVKGRKGVAKGSGKVYLTALRLKVGTSIVKATEKKSLTLEQKFSKSGRKGVAKVFF